MGLADEYLDALESGDAGRVVALFRADGMVDSPLYGRLPAGEFYPALFRDTASSKLTLRSSMSGITKTGAPMVAFWFDFDWTLADGTPAPFTVVDVAELGPDGDIVELHIVYDTAPLRADFERVTTR